MHCNTFFTGGTIISLDLLVLVIEGSIEFVSSFSCGIRPPYGYLPNLQYAFYLKLQHMMTILNAYQAHLLNIKFKIKVSWLKHTTRVSFEVVQLLQVFMKKLETSFHFRNICFFLQLRPLLLFGKHSRQS